MSVSSRLAAFPVKREQDGFPYLAPELAVEVLSPGDRSADVLEKVGVLDGEDLVRGFACRPKDVLD